MDQSAETDDEPGSCEAASRVESDQDSVALQQRFQALYEKTPAMLHSIDRQGRLVSVSNLWLATMGYTREEVLGRKSSEFLTAESQRKAVEEVLPAFMETGCCKDVEYQFIRKDGEILDTLLSATAERDAKGDIVRSLAVISDITAQRRQQATLHRLHEITADRHLELSAKIEAILALGVEHFGLDVGILSDVKDGSYTVRTVTCPGDEICVGQGFELSDTYCERTIGADAPLAFDDVAGTDLHSHPCHRKFELKAYIGAPVVVAGVVRGTLNFSSWVKAKRRFLDDDIEIIRLLAEWIGLQIETDEKTAALERSNADLEQFAHVASHDLQEPLRTISGFCGLLSDRHGDKLDAEAGEYLGFIVDGARRMQQLIDDLLTYARVGNAELNLGAADCDAALDIALANLKVMLDRNDIHIERGDLPEVRGDEVQLIQLFQNLIGNAVKFRRDVPLKIEISATQAEGYWTFSLRDNGIGIDPKHAERIFLVFQRLHTRDAIPGSGIGLALCKKIVERHGGRIWVESEPGKGSCFQFSIPKA